MMGEKYTNYYDPGTACRWWTLLGIARGSTWKSRRPTLTTHPTATRTDEPASDPLTVGPTCLPFLLRTERFS